MSHTVMAVSVPSSLFKQAFSYTFNQLLFRLYIKLTSALVVEIGVETNENENICTPEIHNLK